MSQIPAVLAPLVHACCQKIESLWVWDIFTSFNIVLMSRSNSPYYRLAQLPSVFQEPHMHAFACQEFFLYPIIFLDENIVYK